jgi:hypothetical protein
MGRMTTRGRWLWLGLSVLAGCGGGGGATDGGADGGDGCTTAGNLVVNAGFECGGAAPAEWAPVFGSLEFPAGDARSGQRAAKLTANAQGARFSYVPDLVTAGGNKTYCVTAWAKGTAPFMRLRVLRDDGGGAFTSFDFNAPVPTAWERVPPNLTVVAPNANAARLQLVFELQTNRSDGQNAVPGDVLFIDDVDAWESPSGRCDEVR